MLGKTLTNRFSASSLSTTRLATILPVLNIVTLRSLVSSIAIPISTEHLTSPNFSNSLHVFAMLIAYGSSV